MKVCSGLLILLFVQCMDLSAKDRTPATASVVIEGEVPSFLKPVNASLGTVFELRYFPVGLTSLYPEINSVKKGSSSNKIKWSIQVSGPTVLVSDYLSPYTKGVYPVLATPGDSIKISYRENKRVYSGRGWEKYQLQYDIDLLKIKHPRPTKFNELFINTLDEYFLLNSYCDSLEKWTIPLIDSYKSKLRSFEYNWIRTRQIEIIENCRLNAFIRMIQLYSATRPDDLVAIWDSTHYKPWGKWLRKQFNYHNGESPYYHYFFNNLEVYRKYNFNFKNDTISAETPLFKYLTYCHAQQIYKGLVRERIMAFILDEQTITEIGPDHPIAVKMLNSYYSEPQYPEYKKLIKTLELKFRDLRNNRIAPDFEVRDKDEKLFTKDDFKGKIALFDFWFTGCKPCVEMTKTLTALKDMFRDDTNVVFVNISVDNDKNIWLNSVGSGKYCTPGSVSLYTGELGRKNPIIEKYNIVGYPTLVLLDEAGKILQHPVPDPRIEEGRNELIDLIKTASTRIAMKKNAALYDGPFVFYNKDNITVNYIEPVNEKNGVRSEVINANEKGGLSLVVNTDQPSRTFALKLKGELKNEPCQYSNVPRQLAISDIEGNFDALRELLQANGVIDEHFNWVFGNGHLVFIGDMIDRGAQVTECLWLIYSLEEKAKAAGGYVHYILGNHEIMNMSNDIRYVHEKYKTNADMMGVRYCELFSENTELGKWLRTKNIIEKVGDVLYVHGGISNPLRNLKLNIDQINELARPYYQGNIDSVNKKLLTLFNSSASYDEWDMSSPFWFRYYYKSIGHEKAMPTYEQVDSTRKEFGVNKIVTGHTMVEAKEGAKKGERITTHYAGKIINIDTHHAEGKSEALLIEDGKYYRVNRKGDKMLLSDKNDKPL